MGISGLTTFVSKHSDEFFEAYQLRDCCIVIDGNSLASQLYNCVCKSNNAFGGDYDAYADCIRHYFSVLRKCNITPLILLDGGYEAKKLRTVRSRFQTRICNARKVNPVNQMKRSIFPLFLATVFKDVLFELSIKFVQCAFEADHEIAAVARARSCPVLSLDSDFYIYDVIYIPFDTVSLEAVEIQSDSEKIYAIDCKVYRVEKFLSSFGLEKTILPLMATVLGNDYIQKKVFRNFFSQIKHPRSRSSSDTQRHIVGLLTWLKGKTVSSATAMILACSKQCNRQNVLEQLSKSVEGYSRGSTVLPLLCPDLPDVESPETHGKELHMSPLKQRQQPVHEIVFQALPQWFKENFHKGLLPPCILDMITLHTYFCQPQVEDYSLPHSHELSFIILPVIFGLLTAQHNSTSELTVIFRSKNEELQKAVLNPIVSLRCLNPLPRLEDLPGISSMVRASVILEVVGLDGEVLLETVPDEWKLFVISVVFWARHTSYLRLSLPSMIAAILLTAVALKVVDGVVGYFRKRKHFLKFHGSKVKKLARAQKQILSDEHCQNSYDIPANGADILHQISDKNMEQLNNEKMLMIAESLENVSEADCFRFVETFILFRYIDESLKHNRKLYNVMVVHAFAQFQSCLQHILFLNAVLSFPNQPCKVSSFFSGTAVYNLYTNFQKRANLSQYIVHLFGDCPTVLRLIFSLQNVVMSFLQNNFAQVSGKKHRKKRSTKRKDLKNISQGSMDELTNDESENNDESVFVDENNKFSALSFL